MWRRCLYTPFRPIQRIYHGSRVLVKVRLGRKFLLSIKDFRKYKLSLFDFLRILAYHNVNGQAIGKEKIARVKSIPPSSILNLTVDETDYVIAEVL